MWWMLFASLILAVATALVACLQKVKQNERAIIFFFGKAQKVVGPGPIIEIRGFREAIRYPTEIKTIEVTTEVMTADTYGHSPTGVTAKLTCHFRYPRPEDREGDSDDLIATYENLGDPTDKDHIKNMLEKPILDIAKTVVAEMDWRQLYMEKFIFNQRASYCIAQMLRDDAPPNIIRDAHLRDITILLTEVRIPDRLKNVLTKPEIERVEAKAAEGERDATSIRAEGKAAETRAHVQGALGDNGQATLTSLADALRQRITPGSGRDKDRKK